MCPIILLYPTSILDVKRYALVMAQRAGPRTEHDSEAEILQVPVLRDEVDDLVAAWRAQRPDLDVEPMQVLSRISRLARHLDIARRGAFADHGLESWEFDVLSALRRQGPPFQLTPGALLRATLVTSGTMTNRVDRLAAAGLVRREPDPRDKRGVLVTLTDQGREQVDAALADLLGRERALLAGLDNGERRHLADLMRILLAPFDAVLFRPWVAYSNSAATVSQRSSKSDFSAWTVRSSAPREVSLS
jgi:DNA-binding MarR family transcriptional regulator